jgi:hypothetical protein
MRGVKQIMANPEEKSGAADDVREAGDFRVGR